MKATLAFNICSYSLREQRFQNSAATFMTVQSSEDAPRLKKFRQHLIRIVPRFPNNKAALLHMQQKHLGDILIDYVDWRSRYVGICPRTVVIDPIAIVDSRYLAKRQQVDGFLEKVRRGDDLTPFLSLIPRTRGYTPASRKAGATAAEKWADKDFVLNTMGFHHFHLGRSIERNGHATRTDEIIFARVTREQFIVLGMFDHSVFETESAERMRLFTVHDEYVLRGAQPGQMVIGSMIATSGHATHMVTYALRCRQTLRHLDPLLDNEAYLADVYAEGGRMVPQERKFEWRFKHLDLGFVDMTKRFFFNYVKGWN